jgi:hypothetical protein
VGGTTIAEGHEQRVASLLVDATDYQDVNRDNESNVLQGHYPPTHKAGTRTFSKKGIVIILVVCSFCFVFSLLFINLPCFLSLLLLCRLSPVCFFPLSPSSAAAAAAAAGGTAACSQRTSPHTIVHTLLLLLLLLHCYRQARESP